MADAQTAIQKPAPKNGHPKPAPGATPPAVHDLARVIASRKDAMAQVAAKNFDAGRLVKLAQAAISRTPKIATCTTGSVLICLMRCAELGLEPDAALPTRRMFLVPRWNSKIGKNECTYVMDYRAQLQLARQTGLLKSVLANEVRAKDFFECEFSDAGDSIAKFSHKPKPFGDRGDVVGYYAAARLEGGEVQFYPLSKEDAVDVMERFAPRYKDKIIGPWVSDPDAMSLKTCLRRLFNLLPSGSNKDARRLQEIAAEESAVDAGEPIELETPPELPAETRPTKTQSVKEKLKAKAEAAPASEPVPENPNDPWGLDDAPPPSDEPPPEEN